MDHRVGRPCRRQRRHYGCLGTCGHLLHRERELPGGSSGGGDRNLSRTCTSPRSATTEVAGPPPAPTAPSGCTVVVRRSGDQVSGRYGRACSSRPGDGRTRRCERCSGDCQRLRPRGHATTGARISPVPARRRARAAPPGRHRPGPGTGTFPGLPAFAAFEDHRGRAGPGRPGRGHRAAEPAAGRAGIGVDRRGHRILHSGSRGSGRGMASGRHKGSPDAPLPVRDACRPESGRRCRNSCRSPRPAL